MSRKEMQNGCCDMLLNAKQNTFIAGLKTSRVALALLTLGEERYVEYLVACICDDVGTDNGTDRSTEQIFFISDAYARLKGERIDLHFIVIFIDVRKTKDI